MRKEVIMKKLKTIGLDTVSITFLDKGTSKDSYVINTGQRKFVLKLFDKKDKRKVQREMNILRSINSKEILSLFPIHEKVLYFDSRIGFVYEYVEGTIYGNARIKNKLYLFGKIVGKFNKKTSAIFGGGRSYLFVRKEVNHAKMALDIHLRGNLDFLHKKTKKLLEESLRVIKEEAPTIKLRTQIVHGDLHYSNVVYCKGKAVIIDLDGIQKRPLIDEITTNLSYFSYKSLKKYQKEATKYIKGYESEMKLTKIEKKLIPLNMILRKLGEISYLLKQRMKKKLTKKELEFFLGHTTRKLAFILDNFEDLKKIYAKV